MAGRRRAEGVKDQLALGFQSTDSPPRHGTVVYAQQAVIGGGHLSNGSGAALQMEEAASICRECEYVDRLSRVQRKHHTEGAVTMKKVIVTAVLMLGVLVLGVVSMPWWRYEVETFRGVSIRYDRLTGQMQEWDGESHRWTLKNW